MLEATHAKNEQVRKNKGLVRNERSSNNINMSKSIIVLDDFYSDPYFVRQNAFKMEWLDKYGNHPGRRTYADRHPSVKQALEDAIGKKSY